MKRPALPKTVKVGAHTYEIEKTLATKMVGLMGEADIDGLKIRLKARMRFSKQQEVLLHEVIHGACYPVEGEDEPFVLKVSPVLLQVLQENPELVAFLTWKEET